MSKKKDSEEEKTAKSAEETGTVEKKQDNGSDAKENTATVTPKKPYAEPEELSEEEQAAREKKWEEGIKENAESAKTAVSSMSDGFVMIGDPKAEDGLAQSTMAFGMPHGTIVLRRTLTYFHYGLGQVAEIMVFCPGVNIKEGELSV